MGQIFSGDINTDFVPFHERVPAKAFDKNCFYIDVYNEKKITRFAHSLLKVAMRGAAPGHFDS